jgi:hypothetical protein
MFTAQRLSELEQRKQLLLAQSAIQRGLIQLHAHNAAGSLNWVQPVQRMMHTAGPWAWIAAPVAGFFVARNWRSALRWGLRGLSLWRLVRPLLKPDPK